MKNDKIIKIIRVAKKYYESHMDQKIIAQEEGISVSTVSRMLKKAEEMGYIKITVEYPVLSNEEVSDSLKKRYGLHTKKKDLIEFIFENITPAWHGKMIEQCSANRDERC